MSDRLPPAFDSGGFAPINNKEIRLRLRDYFYRRPEGIPRRRFGHLVPNGVRRKIVEK